MRATLEQHVHAEEQELWPLFAENFSVDEQEAIVGLIIGRTGAEVLQAMLPWITGNLLELRIMVFCARMLASGGSGFHSPVFTAKLPFYGAVSFTETEQAAMMDSFRKASKNTMFEAWLDATRQPAPHPASGTAVTDTVPPAAAGWAQPGGASLDDLTRYLGDAPKAAEDVVGGRAAVGEFKPGWQA